MFSGLASIFVSMLMKLLGYDFITKVTVVGLQAWAGSTQTHKDDEVVAAMAKAWGVSTDDVKNLGAANANP
jgi:hypothetical protein